MEYFEYFLFQALSVNTYDGLKREMRAPVPPFFNIPIKFKSETHAIMVVSREEWLYQNGNDKNDFKFEDCLSWKKLSELTV